eukprot:2082016-Lingulodinium_polyedra.AAC.1
MILLKRNEIEVMHADMPFDASDDCVFRYGLIDSSPQANHDWVWCQHHEVARSKLAPLAEAIDELVPMLQAGQDAAVELEPPAVARPLLRLVGDSITEHISPPASVTSGMRQLARKVSAMLWSMALQMPSRHSLELFLRSFVPMTSNFGVEIGIANFEVQNIDAFLPRWH